MWKKFKNGDITLAPTEDLVKNLIEVATSANFIVNLSVLSYDWSNVEITGDRLTVSERENPYLITVDELLKDADFLVDFEKAVKGLNKLDLSLAGIPQYILGEDITLLSRVFDDITTNKDSLKGEDKLILVPFKDYHSPGFPMVTGRVFPRNSNEDTLEGDIANLVEKYIN